MGGPEAGKRAAGWLGSPRGWVPIFFDNPGAVVQTVGQELIKLIGGWMQKGCCWSHCPPPIKGPLRLERSHRGCTIPEPKGKSIFCGPGPSREVQELLLPVRLGGGVVAVALPRERQEDARDGPPRLSVDCPHHDGRQPLRQELGTGEMEVPKSHPEDREAGRNQRDQMH